MIVSLVFLFFTGFLALTHSQYADLNEKKSYAAMTDLANSIRNEVMMATKVHNNYIRNFEIPYKINGKDYHILLEKDVITITNEDNASVTIVLPTDVKGKFIERTELGQLKHCITKNELDGIRISRNLASIELEQDALLKDSNNDGILDIPAGNEFYAYVRMNCLDNIQTVGFTLQLNNLYFDPATGYELIYQYNELGELQDQFNNPFFYETPDEKFILEKWDYTTRRLSFIIPQKKGQASSGSGNIIKLRLKAISSGKAAIDFVPDTIILVDITATPLTKEALPSSNLGAEIKVI